ncbi:MAG: YqeG family HAD IIIA-type phosphatase [Mycoplasmataceae bacterium]|nr:YqeG family HAD IIIA-type phosphatase [Mycoplasmataceae bacterium]
MPQKYKHKSTEQIQENSSSFLLGFFVNYLRPSAYVTSIQEIDLDLLKKQGIKLIICDLDNTLVPHFTKFPTKKAKDFVDKVKEKEFNFILVSNNTSKRVSFFAEKLNLKNYISNAKKPFPKEIKKTIEKIGVKPQETVIIGDMLITDILVANFIHTESILVQPLIDPEKTMNKILLFVEKFIFKKLTKDNLIVKSEIIKKTIYNEDYEIL